MLHRCLAGLLLALGIAAGAGRASAAEPLTLSVGEGPGRLRIASFFPSGAIDGDDGTFTTAFGSATTIWNNCFLIHDGTTPYWVDVGFDAHRVQPVNGKVEPGGNGFVNSGITFPKNADLRADLGVSLTRPKPGEALVTWRWAFTSSAKAPTTLRMLWFLDADNYLGDTQAADDISGLVGTLEKYEFRNPLGGIALGHAAAPGAIDLSGGIVLDTDRTPTGLFAIADPSGSSYYWTATRNFGTTGPSVAGYRLPDKINWTAALDMNKDGFSDVPNDVGGVVEVTLEIPPGGTESVRFFATWGIPETTRPGTFRAPASKAGS